MADILLQVGVDPSLSYTQMQSDISTLIGQLNSNPPKVMVTLEVNYSELENLRTQIEGMNGMLGNLASVRVDTGGMAAASNEMKDIAANAKEAASAAREVGAGFNTASPAISSSAKQTREYNNALKQSQTLLAQVNGQLSSWTAAKNGRSSAAYNDLIQYSGAIQQLSQQLQDGAISVEDFRAKLSGIQAGVATAGASIKAAGENTLSFTDRLKTLSSKFGHWFSITRVIMAAYRALREMVESVIAVDTAMTELKKVTDETDATYEKFLTNAISRAKELGASLSDVVTATANFARLGFNIDDATSIADAALVYKNVGDGITDINKASESIVSTMQAFGIEASDAMSIVDKFNAVGNNYAISSSGIGEALKRSAAAMQAANNSLDETIALAAAANTIIQDPEKVGTTLKTVSMYLRAAKTEAEDAGESTDGMANSISELRDEILDLTGQKVDIQIDDDTFKSTYQILEELSGVWEELSDISQANIINLVGGKRNANVVAAILENFDIAKNALKTSMEDSMGSAIAENEKYLDSVQGKIDVMKASFESFSQSFIGSDLTKGVVEFVTKLLDALDGIASFINECGGLKTAILGVAAAFLMFKPAALVTIFTTLSGAASKLFGILSVGATTAVNSLGELAWAVATGASAFEVFQAAIPVIGLVLVAITALTAGINKYKTSLEEARREAEEDAQALQDQNSAIEEYKVKIQTLTKELESGNLSEQEAYDKRSQLIEIERELIDMFGAEADGINLVTGEINAQIDAIDELANKSYSNYLVKHSEEIKDATNAFLDDLIGEDLFGSFYIPIPKLGDLDTAQVGKTVSDYYEILGDALNKTGLVDITDNLKAMPENVRAKLDVDNIYELLDAYTALASAAHSANREFFGADYLSFVGDSLGGFSDIIEGIEAEIDKYEEIFNSYSEAILNTDTEYAKVWGNILAAQQKYTAAILKGDDDTVAGAIGDMDIASAMFDSMVSEGSLDNAAVNLYVERFIEAFENGVKMSKAKISLADLIESSDENYVRKALIGALKLAVDEFTTDEGEIVLPVSPDVLVTEESQAAWALLDAQASKYGITVTDLISLLSQLGVISASIQAPSADGIGNLVQSYDKLKGSVDDVMTVASESGGIFSDNTYISEDLYNAIVSLVGGETDLSGAIDTTNGYLITNADALADIVNESAAAVEQNIKLAESHELLNYHNLVQQLQDVVTGTTDFNDATSATVDSILDQIEATDLQIAKFALLEQQLLGATDAFTDYEKAQQYDVATDYTDDMASMIEGLIGTYSSHEFGTEAFWTAFESLVPEDVYSQFEDVGDQIDAGWEYINTKLARYFTYDEGNVSITESNVQKFVTDALNTAFGNSTVFTGSLADFDLNASITSVEQLADAMGITTTAAFTLGNAISKYSADNEDFLSSLSVDSLEGKIYDADQRLLELLEHQNELGESGKVGTDEWNEVSKAIQDVNGELELYGQLARADINHTIEINTNIAEKQQEVDDLYNKLQTLDETDPEYTATLTNYTDAMSELTELVQQKYNLEEPTELTIKVALEQVQSEIDTTVAALEEIATFDGETYTANANVDQSQVDELVGKLDSLKAEKQSIEMYANIDSEDVEATLNRIQEFTIEDKKFAVAADTDDAMSDLDEVQAVRFDDKTVRVSASLGSTLSDLQSVINKLSSIQSKTVTVTTITQTVSGDASAYGTARASGSWSIPEKEDDSLVGELGQELVVDPRSGTYYTVGDMGAEFVDLPKGAIVFNHKQTEGILKNKRINSRGTAYARGNAHFTFIDKDYTFGNTNKNDKYDDDKTSYNTNYTPSYNTSYSPSYSPSYSGSGYYSGSSSSSSSSDEESEFERQYKYHQHLLAMDQESVENYLKWLDGAYKTAYQQRVIELDDYYKYEEEVYTGRQDLFKDYLSDIEHEISMRENYDGESDIIISLYRKMMQDLEKEIAAARQRGLNNNDDYMQELLSQWQDCANAINDIQEDVAMGAKDAIDELVEYRIDMLKQEIEDEKDALNDRLDDLKNFYDKLKEMIEDYRDNEQYLEDRDEKRKSVSDIRAELDMLSRDDSAWAQKRKRELEEELADAEKDLSDFEEDKTYSDIFDMLDKMHKSQESTIQTEIDALDEKLNDPEALYNKSLSDVKTNTQNIFDEMIEYNRKHGTGNDVDVKEIYENAFKALLSYKDIFGEHYNDIVLPNSTNYQPSKGSWEDTSVSGVKKDDDTQDTPSTNDQTSNSGAASKKEPSRGDSVKIKTSATHYGTKSNNIKMFSFVPGSTYTVDKVSDGQVLVKQGKTYIGWVNLSDIEGYAAGTNYASDGLHRIDELGSEYLFTSGDGRKYRVLNDGDKVLSARASEFLYNFANGGTDVFTDSIKRAFDTSALLGVTPSHVNNEINMGDIIVQGNADMHTVSEVRRAQRNSLETMLRELNKLNR